MNTTNQLVTGTRNGNELIITLVGRINSNNAPERYIQFGIQKTRTKLFPIIDRLIATEIPF